MPRRLSGALIFGFMGLCIGYVLATEYLAWLLSRDISYLFIVRNLSEIASGVNSKAVFALYIIGALGIIGIGLSLKIVTEELTTYGKTDWQTKREMLKNKWFTKPGEGFLFAKVKPKKLSLEKLRKSKPNYICNGKHPHCMVIAPTGRGKGRGFVIPNLLQFTGSVVVLDVKSENYQETARLRHKMGCKVIRFAPTDYLVDSSSYNPLRRIANINDPGEQMLEMERLSTLFLKTSNEKNASLLDGGRQAFVAAGMLAIEQGQPTLARIYDLINGGVGGLNEKFRNYARETSNPTVATELNAVANNDPDSLANMISIMNNAGLSPWKHKRIRELTSKHDFDFADIRRSPHAIYFTVATNHLDMIDGLVRLFFTDLVASLETRKPGPDEPYLVQIILDEFHKLGKMSELSESITTLRGYGGRMSIITQSIPKLLEIYGENEFRSLEAGCGVKMYMTPSDKVTRQEVSDALGKTTKRSISKSRQNGIFSSENITERTEEAALMDSDAISQMPLDDVILIGDGEKPVLGTNIYYYEDSPLKDLHEAQQVMPWPVKDDGGVVSADPFQTKVVPQSDQLEAIAIAVEKLDALLDKISQRQDRIEQEFDTSVDVSPRIDRAADVVEGTSERLVFSGRKGRRDPAKSKELRDKPQAAA